MIHRREKEEKRSERHNQHENGFDRNEERDRFIFDVSIC